MLFLLYRSLILIKLFEYNQNMKFLKFLFSGFLTYGINIGLTYLLVDFFWVEKYLSYAFSIAIVTICNFTISLLFTFKKRYSHKLMMKYVGSLLLFSFLNYMVVFLLQSYFQGNFYYLLIFLVTTIIFFLKFHIYDNFVFK